MRYFVWRKQKGTGCDYMIGCGQNVSELKASNREDAIAEVMGLDDNWKNEVLEQAGKDAGIRDVEDYLSDYISDTSLRDVQSGWDWEMENVRLLEVSAEVNMIPLMKAKLAEVDEWKLEMRTKIQEQEERAAYEKMKAKFEPKKAANE
jgi:hypothetical protein